MSSGFRKSGVVLENCLIDDDADAEGFYKAVQQGSDFLDPPDYARKMLEWMYQECKDVLDRKFKSQIKADFSASFAELYFAATTRIRYGYKVKHLADFGPDFYFPDFNLHCEVTSIKNGNSEFNSVPVFDDGVVHSYPEDKVILRLTGAIDQKLTKIKKYIECLS